MDHGGKILFIILIVDKVRKLKIGQFLVLFTERIKKEFGILVNGPGNANERSSFQKLTYIPFNGEVHEYLTI